MDSIMNPDDFGLFVSESFDNALMEQIQSAFAATDSDLKRYAANVLIGNASARRLSDAVNQEFQLYGFHVKDATFEAGKKGHIIYLFGMCSVQRSIRLCAYSTTSEKVYYALKVIASLYGNSMGKDGVHVKILMNALDNDSKSYSLEVL